MRTAAGEASQADPKIKMSPAFRRMLRLLDGSRSLADLGRDFPQLDAEDLRLWISELLRQKMIKRAPALTNSQRIRMRANAPAAEIQVEKIAEEIRPWLAEKDIEHSGPRPRPAQLARTARLAAIEARTAADSIGREGFFLEPEQKRKRATTGAALVLVVEDDEIQAKVIGKFLEQDGHQVRLAHSGSQAQAILREKPLPALVLLDVELPDMDGFSLLEQIRAQRATQSLRVIMVTAHAAEADLAKGVVLGANGYLTKPFQRAMLKAAVGRLLPGA
ncbi:MAG TPA: response regulator [Burkholderiales bacterium]